MLDLGSYLCATCEQRYPLSSLDWLRSCSGLFEFDSWPAFEAALIGSEHQDRWRYRRLLALELSWEPVMPGEGGTPLWS